MDKKLVIDISKCTGCESCITACSFHHGGEFSVKKSRIQVVKEKESGVCVPLTCQHCGDAPCAQVCPTNAIKHDSEINRVFLDSNKCIGCGICGLACPFGAISYENKTKLAFKCDLCNGDPMCAKVCNPKAIQYTESEKMEKDKREQLAQKLINVSSSNGKVV
jgi:anaerobic carbon-monoxide dehydrogenase iron sulfur subunit